MITQETNLNDAELMAAFKGPSTESIDNSPRAQRLRRVNAARAMLARKGFNQYSPVFVTAAEILDDSDLDQALSPNKPLPQVCEVTGHYAAYFIADRSHRLSTEEEIFRFRGEQIAREKKYFEIESKNPNNKHVHQTITYVNAVDAKPVGIPATAEAPALPSRRDVAGEKENKK
jgi:hypothetical protein